MWAVRVAGKDELSGVVEKHRDGIGIVREDKPWQGWVVVGKGILRAELLSKQVSQTDNVEFVRNEMAGVV